MTKEELQKLLEALQSELDLARADNARLHDTLNTNRLLVDQAHELLDFYVPKDMEVPVDPWATKPRLSRIGLNTRIALLAVQCPKAPVPPCYSLAEPSED